MMCLAVAADGGLGVGIAGAKPCSALGQGCPLVRSVVLLRSLEAMEGNERCT